MATQEHLRSIYYLLVPNLFAAGSVLHMCAHDSGNPIVTTVTGGMLALPIAVWTGDWISEPDGNAGELLRLLVVFALMAAYMYLLAPLGG